MRKMNSRTFHRYLSIVIGIQLLLWTISGLIFSWNSIDKVRGEHFIRDSGPVDLSDFEVLDIQSLLSRVDRDNADVKTISKVELRTMLGKPVFEVQLTGRSGEAGVSILDAVTGERLSPISEKVATQIVQSDFSEDAQVVKAELIESNVGSHSEYRGKELPAWRVELDHESGTVIYVSADRGVVTTRRNNRWRLFDFFWMLHTMDYQGRDNFNSWLLRSFSIFGVATVLSGYWLWWRSSRLRRWKNRSNSKSEE